MIINQCLECGRFWRELAKPIHLGYGNYKHHIYLEDDEIILGDDLDQIRYCQCPECEEKN